MRYEPQEPFAWRDIARVFALFAAFALLLMAIPAYAEVYGPPAPEAPITRDQAEANRAEYRIALDDDAKAARDANRWLVGFEIANAADVASTCIVLSRGGHEANPIYGRNASCGKIAAIKAGIGIFEWVVIRKLIRDDPYKARTVTKILTVVQGLVVGWNIGQIAKQGK